MSQKNCITVDFIQLPNDRTNEYKTSQLYKMIL